MSNEPSLVNALSSPEEGASSLGRLSNLTRQLWWAASGLSGAGIGGMACALVLVGAMSSFVLGAEVKTPQMTQQEISLASNFNRGRQAASDEAKQALQKQVVVHLSKLTQANEILNYTQHRRNIELLLAEPRQPAEARDTVVKTLVYYASNVAARDTFSSSARINCTAILAELDEKAENSRDRTPPLPSPGAFATLKKLAADATAPLHLRAIALHGLERHARVYWDSTLWDDAQRAEIQKIATDILAAGPATALDEQAYAWLTRRAYDILGVAKVPAAVDLALEQLADMEALPSVRLSALSYLCELDATVLPAEKQTSYMIALTHFMRSQLVNWYEYQEDIIKRDTNAQAGGMGGMMGMGGSGGEGGEGGMMDSMMGRGRGMMGGRGGMMGGMEGMGGGAKPKPIDTQDWRTRGSRRLLNQISQQVHVALDGQALADTSTVVDKPLSSIDGNPELASQVKDLVDLVEEFQTAINDAVMIKNINSLLDNSKLPIENIMEFSIELPGFTDRYPHLAEEKETLEDVPEAPAIEDPEEGDEPPAESGDGQDAPAEDPATSE